MIGRADSRAWHQGPEFIYRGSGKITINVTGSSWTIRGLDVAEAVVAVLTKHKKLGGTTILDFGAGSWLRYEKRIYRMFPARELFVVEYEEAFHEEALAERKGMENDVTFWRPVDFVQHKKQRFDLALLINVLNTIPEESHRRSAFAAVADRLNPRGWLVLYQRIWAERENPKDAIEYGEGWIVPQPRYGYCTYRARTGARWFNQQAQEAELRSVDTGVELSSSNTLLRVWEKPF